MTDYLLQAHKRKQTQTLRSVVQIRNQTINQIKSCQTTLYKALVGLEDMGVPDELRTSAGIMGEAFLALKTAVKLLSDLKDVTIKTDVERIPFDYKPLTTAKKVTVRVRK